MFVFNEGTMDVPHGWRDQTINVVSSSGPLEPGLTLSITRDDIPWGMAFNEYVEDQVNQVSDALTDFKLLARKPVTIARAAAFEVEITWMSKQGPMHQIITTVQLPEGRAMVVTGSMPGMMTPGQANEVRRIVSTLNLQQPKRS